MNKNFGVPGSHNALSLDEATEKKLQLEEDVHRKRRKYSKEFRDVLARQNQLDQNQN